jgi:polyphosphate glucokinase
VATKKATQSRTSVRPRTLAIDIGGSGLKALVLDPRGEPLTERVRIPTTYPCPPDRLVSALVELVQPLGAYDRVSVGFPGVVRDGKVLTAWNLSRQAGPNSPIDEEVAAAWRGFDLADALTKAFGKPTRVANDADMQGAAVVNGRGVELVLTLGTGFGSTVYADGRLACHLEIAHHPFRKGETYEEQVGEVAREQIGNGRWSRRVARAVDQLDTLVTPDHIFIGGGNAKHLKIDLAERVTIVPNTAGLLGGIKLWQDARPRRHAPTAGTTRPG